MAVHCVSVDCKSIYTGFVLSNARHQSSSRIAFQRMCSPVSQSKNRPSFSTLRIMHPRQRLIQYGVGAESELRHAKRTLPNNLGALSKRTSDIDHGVARGVGPNQIVITASEAEGDTGPQELPPSLTEIDPFSMPEATPLQTVASVALTGAITVLLLRSLRRRSKRSKEMKFRANVVERLEQKAPEAVVSEEVEKPPPSVLSTLGGAAVAGLISYVLYNFTTGVEDQFSLKAVSANYSVRNLTITVRTIITGMCWLGTFVFGANALGLALYAGQLALGLNPEAMVESGTERKDSSLLDEDKNQ